MLRLFDCVIRQVIVNRTRGCHEVSLASGRWQMWLEKSSRGIKRGGPSCWQNLVKRKKLSRV
jgi:hypothetical protein